MKQSRFSEDQIFGILKETDAGGVGESGLPASWCEPGDVLSVEGEVRRA
jgi:hypothetical protein